MPTFEPGTTCEEGAGMSVGAHHTCGLLSDGSNFVLCWGADFDGGVSTPPGATVAYDPSNVVFIQVSSGEGHTCGIRDTQYAVCWGSDAHGQVIPPGIVLCFYVIHNF